MDNFIPVGLLASRPALLLANPAFVDKILGTALVGINCNAATKVQDAAKVLLGKVINSISGQSGIAAHAKERPVGDVQKWVKLASEMVIRPLD
jgi:hypothetical protein